jgi:hypothetical protein
MIGVFYNRETQIGKIVNDISSSIGADFTVDRLGAINLLRLENPNATLDDSVTINDIYLSGFQKKTGDHIRHVRTKSAKLKITVRYNINFTVQNESELASSVSATKKSEYSQPYDITEISNSLTNYVDPEDLIIDTFLSFEPDAEDLRDYYADLWSEDRQEYEWHTNLYWQTLLSDFGLGSIIEVNGDIRHPEFADGDRVQVIQRKVNWSKDTQELRVFR